MRKFARFCKQQNFALIASSFALYKVSSSAVSVFGGFNFRARVTFYLIPDLISELWNDFEARPEVSQRHVATGNYQSFIKHTDTILYWSWVWHFPAKTTP